MDLDDRITIAAPEGVELQLVLAGLGSRFIGGAIDLIVQSLLILILAVVTVLTATSTTLVLVVFYIGLFLVTFAYPILFEVRGGGRTPGKRMAHTRVLRAHGAPVDLPASAIRNLMRLLD
ncbi:MAG: RDD family protein, partial [Actinomycetota bacterium]|nr:RDD family protein [Actinomycetota bacterium]